MSKQKGFTLIELLVVIAIIAILAAVVLVALGNARDAARDSARKADINSIMTAIELYNTNNAGYPGEGVCGAAGVISLTASGTVCGGDSFADATPTTYIQSLPVDPGTGADYTWTSVNNYTLTATLSDASLFTCTNGSCY